MRRGVYTSVAALALAGAIAGTVFGQAGPAGTSRNVPVDDLIAEVRALRAEIREAVNSSLRAQLLAVRLQLQEQRITALSRELSDVQEQLRGNEQARSAMSAQLKLMTQVGAEKQEFAQILEPIKTQLAQLDETDERLKGEEINLSQLLAEEQARWSRFNDLIEELERAAAKPAR